MIRWAVFALVLTLLFFQATSTDLWLQSRLFDVETGNWIWSKQEPVTRFLLYDGPRVALVLLGVGLLATLVASRWIVQARERRLGLSIAFLTLVLAPAAAGSLKAVTNVACPSHLIQFGGSVPYVPLFDRYPEETRPTDRQRCFPAGHASGGYALISLLFLCRTRRAKQLAAIGGIAAGSVMGSYKMVIGDHFLSDTIVSLELSVLMIGLIYAAMKYAPPSWQADRERHS